MNLSIYQVDAFASRPFEGNPAAVVPLSGWLPDSAMQAIAEENNLAETAFFVATDSGFHIRWFTPEREVQLCGHATLAAAHVLYKHMDYESELIRFDSLSGELLVMRQRQQDELLTLDFPSQPAAPCDLEATLITALGVEPEGCYGGEDYLAVLESEQQLVDLQVDMGMLAQLDRRGVIVTAPSAQYDFVARFFAPKFGIPEDSVTGSAYTQLTPYWSKRLGKTRLSARQLSSRGGDVYCEQREDRVWISGSAVTYLLGQISLPDR